MRIEQRGRSHALAHSGPQRAQPLGIARKLNGPLHVVLARFGHQVREADPGEQARAGSRHRGRPGQRHDRHPHPQRLAGLCYAVARESIERDIDFVVFREMPGEGFIRTAHFQPLAPNAVFRELADER
ncbi:hypothetical protein D3C83_38770 [compost metagenome]